MIYSGFDPSSISGKNILIKTFMFESGLWYLAKSLGDILSKSNNVSYIPKARYTRAGSIYVRSYPRMLNRAELIGVSHVGFSNNTPIGPQVYKSIRKHDADIIISFETLMSNSSWISYCKNRSDVEIYDVPMPEWVTKKSLISRRYSIFDKILCLTQQSLDVFRGYHNATPCGWKYMEDKGVVKRNDRIIFYHPASINTEFSTKNTDVVLMSMKKFINSRKLDVPVSLIVTGNLPGNSKDLCSGLEDILIINNYVDRQGVFNILEESNCLIAPSKIEGLGLSFFEAKAFGCSIITTNYPPMSNYGDYLCDIAGTEPGIGETRLAKVKVDDLTMEVNKYYEDFINGR